MYEEFYGLTRSPFEVSPDPFFLYPTAPHLEALAMLAYAVLRRKGFVVVTGEVGTGKSLLARCLLDRLSKNNVAFALLTNPTLSAPEFLSAVIHDLSIPATGIRSKAEALSRLNEYLLDRSSQDQITALVVDEAQLLSWEVLEEIRLLTNLETTQHKLLQVVLLGQLEFDHKLDSPELRQLKQRVVLRSSLRPLDPEEARGYIQRRLELAGANSHSTEIFPDETIAQIQQLSGGIPRLVNVLCENSLLLGFGRGQRQISSGIVHEVAAELRLDRFQDKPPGRLRQDAPHTVWQIQNSPESRSK